MNVGMAFLFIIVAFVLIMGANMWIMNNENR